MYFSFFFFNDTATTEIYTLSLHDALPISSSGLLDRGYPDNPGFRSILPVGFCQFGLMSQDGLRELFEAVEQALQLRSEEHTSELQSHFNLLCRLLLLKKKKIHKESQQ